MTPRIPTTKREKWHRKEDRWTWRGAECEYASPIKPIWMSSYQEWRTEGNVTVGHVIKYEDGSIRWASLCRIAPAAKARKVHVRWLYLTQDEDYAFRNRRSATYMAGLDVERGAAPGQIVGATFSFPSPKKASKP